MFGPVIISELYFVPSVSEIGTTFLASISGCLAFLSTTLPEVLIIGTLALILYAKFAFAKITASLISVSYEDLIDSAKFATSADNSAKIRSISSFSFNFKTRRSLLISTIGIGSIKSVAPEEDESCTIPANSPLNSVFTGTTNLPSRWVIIDSCKNFE